jgi:O-antigen/teichoic acid export membrane protein
MKQYLNSLYKDSLYRNSLFLMVNVGIMSFLGFVFWMIAAQYFPPEDIGLASALISTIGIITALSSLGFQTSLIHFLPKSHRKEEKIWSTFWLSTMGALVLSVLFVLGTNILMPSFTLFKDSQTFSILFVLFAIFAVLFNLLDSIFIAIRRSDFVLWKNCFWSVLKVIGMLALVTLGTYGIIVSWFATLAVTFLLSLLLMNLKILFKINWDIIRNMLKYSVANWLANLFVVLPALGLPILIAYFLGTAYTAYFYVAWTIAALLFFVPQSVGKSYLSEESLIKTDGSLNKALKFTYFITLIGVVVCLFASPFILKSFGEDYFIAGFPVLVVLILSSLSYSFNAVMTMYYNTTQKIGKVIWINATITLLTFVFVILTLNYGLIGVALSWTSANIVANGIIILGELNK